MISRLSSIALLSLMGLGLSSCGAGRNVPDTLPPGTQFRPIEQLPPVIDADIITVGQFRSVCDRLARSLIVQDFVSRSPRPPVITIKQLENKTDVRIDKSIFQETIRAQLMEHAGGRVLFRDDVSYRDIVQERVRQGENDVTVTLTDSALNTKTTDEFGEKQFDLGSLSGIGGSTEDSNNQEDETEMTMEQSGSVSGKVAAADYFLRGIIFQMKEQDATDRQRGMNYFQYQFRLVDARSGIIVWEKLLDSKLEGTYAPLQPLQNNQAAVPGALPLPGQPGQPGLPLPGQPPGIPGQPGQFGQPGQGGSNWQQVPGGANPMPGQMQQGQPQQFPPQNMNMPPQQNQIPRSGQYDPNAGGMVPGNSAIQGLEHLLNKIAK